MGRAPGRDGECRRGRRERREKSGKGPEGFPRSYRIFRRFSLIDYSDDIDQEDGKVRLYPSLQFCMDVEQLKQVMEE